MIKLLRQQQRINLKLIMLIKQSCMLNTFMCDLEQITNEVEDLTTEASAPVESEYCV